MAGDTPSGRVTGPADAARSLNETRAIVASFRPRTTPATASLSPDPSSVLLLSDGAWHPFTVLAGEPVDVVANPGAISPRVQVDGASAPANACPAEPDDSVRRSDGQTIHIAGCAPGTGVVRLVRAADQTVLRTYVFSINDRHASERERAALEAYYHSTSGPDWTNSTNWLTDAPVATWHGVITDEAGRVTALDLQQNQMTGSIPPEIGNLTHLRRLDFWDNRLTGPIPAEMGDLTNLYRLAFTGNRLTGSIPSELGDLTNLEFLSLSGNQLTGSIPVELGNLLNVEWVGLSANQLTGRIPASIGDLLACRGRLDVSNNQLTGPVPAELGDLINLTQLYFHDNPLTGPLPRTLMDLPNLEWLWFQDTDSVCAPADAEFQAWLRGLTNVQGPTCGANRPPEPVGTLAPLTIGVDEAAVTVEVADAFRDPDGDALTYGATSSAPDVVTVRVAGARVTLAAAGVGTATIEVTATDPDGLSATQSFRVRVTAPFTDEPIQPGVTPVRAVHFTELRARIDALRELAGLGRFRWTDPVLRPGVTPVRLLHLLELRSALGAAYAASGRAVPRWTDAAPATGVTAVRAVHLMELRGAVLALE